MSSRTIALCLCSLLLAATCASAVEYQIVSLGVLPGAIDSVAIDTNVNGQVVGHSGNGAFLWQNGVMQDLGTLSGVGESSAYGINDSGQVVGFSAVSSWIDHAFLWQNGVMQDLGTLPGHQYSHAYGINNQGQIVGASRLSDEGADHPSLWQNGVIQELGTLPGDLAGWAFAINDSGQIVGVSIGPEGPNHSMHGVLWQNGVVQPLGTLVPPGSDHTNPNDINDNGQVVGSSGGGFLWEKGTMHQIAGLNWPSAINNHGQVVGSSGLFSGHAILWQNGVTQDLGTLPGDDYSRALGINDSGQIVGYSHDPSTNANHAVLWNPVPEPSSLSFLTLALAGVGVGVMRRRRA